MEIVIYRRQRVEYGEQDYTTCLVPQFACYAAGPSEIWPQRILREQSGTASQPRFFKRLRQYPEPHLMEWYSEFKKELHTNCT